MRGLLLLAVLALAGCEDSPGALGITGPTSPAPGRAAPDDSTIGNPGIPDSGNGYGPSMGPSPTGGKFFNYN